MNIIKLIFIFILFTSCDKGDTKKNDKKEQFFLTTDKVNDINKVKIYNSILNNLLETNIKYAFLSKKGIKLQIDFINNKIDSLTYSKLENNLKNKITSNDSLKNKLLIVSKNRSDNKVDLTHINFKDSFDKAKEDIEIVLNKPMAIGVSKLKTSFVILKENVRNVHEPLARENKLYFSDIYFSENYKQGILYYEFVCSSKCGHASILIIKKYDDNWEIENTILIWKM